jgi:hypothetical protein
LAVIMQELLRRSCMITAGVRGLLRRCCMITARVRGRRRSTIVGFGARWVRGTASTLEPVHGGVVRTGGGRASHASSYGGPATGPDLATGLVW